MEERRFSCLRSGNQNPGWLACIEDYTVTQFYKYIIISHYISVPINQPQGFEHCSFVLSSVDSGDRRRSFGSMTQRAMEPSAEPIWRRS